MHLARRNLVRRTLLSLFANLSVNFIRCIPLTNGHIMVNTNWVIYFRNKSNIYPFYFFSLMTMIKKDSIILLLLSSDTLGFTIAN